MNNPKKWADKDCPSCGGEGELEQVSWDNERMETYTCRCVLTNRAEYEGEMQFELERGN